MKNSFRIAEISLGRSQWDYMSQISLEGYQFKIHRYGTNFSTQALRQTIQTLRSQVDAFAIAGFPPPVYFGNKSYIHPDLLEILSTPSTVPLCDGSVVRELSILDSTLRLINDKKIMPEHGIFFPSGLVNLEVAQTVEKKYPHSIYYGDAFVGAGLPFVVQHRSGLNSLAKGLMTLASLKDVKRVTPQAQTYAQKIVRSSISPQIENIQYVFSDLGYLLLFDQGTSFIQGKDVIIFNQHKQMENELHKFNPRSVQNLFPSQFRHFEHMDYAILDAAYRLIHDQASGFNIRQWSDLLKTSNEAKEIILKSQYARKEAFATILGKSKSQIRKAVNRKDSPDFAFVVHALSRRDLARVPGLSFIKHLPEEMGLGVEKTISKLPGVKYGEISGIISPKTGKEVRGIIYGLFSTPRMLKEEPPEAAYDKIQKIAEDAAQRGAKILGLGAYTKIVGDSGSTIHRNSPIPVTTGNSLSASATLWALHEAVKKMGLVHAGPLSQKVMGSAMVIGATGSIGKVSAKLLSLVFNKLYLIAPRENRLLEVKEEILKLSPQCEVIIGTNANQFAAQIDALVTATSSFDEKVIDLELIKPGCVICDCSRPLDFSDEDARKRPDILIIESGEVILPGPMKLTCDIGLPKGMVYACLGETALLAMEERYEPFTLGRDIEWAKVKEIYKLAREHKVELASIHGHMGMISDKEILLARELALKKRNQRGL